ncbi:hypothetical protein E2C01_066814 [Portunus trituberculatus]|uniref:Uncharacterized protein n=1 Tax=Portunus trituberculatus TaxID=210409 RepID=A0A5B7HRZ2_PORTR|nr:hypothetical protein [Portunus trituberculatus]
MFRCYCLSLRLEWLVDLQQGGTQRPLPGELPGEDIGEHLSAEVTKRTLSLNLLGTGCGCKLFFL